MDYVFWGLRTGVNVSKKDMVGEQESHVMQSHGT